MAGELAEDFIITETGIILGDAFTGEVISAETEILLSEISSSTFSVAGDIMTEQITSEVALNASIFMGENQDLFSNATLGTKITELNKEPTFLQSIAELWSRDMWNCKVFTVEKEKHFNLWYYLNRAENEKKGQIYKWGKYQLTQLKPKWYYLNYFDDKNSDAYKLFKKAKEDWYYDLISSIFEETWYYRDKIEQIIIDVKNGNLLRYRGVLFSDKIIYTNAIEKIKTFLITFRMLKILYWNFYWKSNYILGNVEYSEIPATLREPKQGGSSAPSRIHVYTPINLGVNRNDWYFHPMLMNTGAWFTENETNNFANLFVGRDIATDTKFEEHHDTNLSTYFKKTKEQVLEDHRSKVAYRIMDEVWTLFPHRGYKFTGSNGHTPPKTPSPNLQDQKELFDSNIPEKKEWFGASSSKYPNGTLYYKQEIRDYIKKKTELYIEFLDPDIMIGTVKFLKFLQVLLKPDIEPLYENESRDPEILLTGTVEKEFKVGDKVRKRFNKVEGVINKIETKEGDLKYAVTFKNDESGEEWVLSTGIERIPPPPTPQRFPIDSIVQGDYFKTNYWYGAKITAYNSNNSYYSLKYDSGDEDKRVLEKYIRYKPVWVYLVNGDLKTGELHYINTNGTYFVMIDAKVPYGQSFKSVYDNEPDMIGKSEFRIGDRIKSADDTKIGFVISINYNLPINYTVQLDNGSFISTSGDTFKVGDKVKIIGGRLSEEGEFSIATQQENNYMLTDGNMTMGPYTNRDLKLSISTANTWYIIPNPYENYDLKFELDQICKTSGWVKDKKDKLNYINRIVSIYEIQSRKYHYYRVFDKQTSNIFSIDEKDLVGIREQFIYNIGSDVLFYNKSAGLQTGKVEEFFKSYFLINKDDINDKVNNGYKINYNNNSFIVPTSNIFSSFIEGKINIRIFDTSIKSQLKLYIPPPPHEQAPIDQNGLLLRVDDWVKIGTLSIGPFKIMKIEYSEIGRAELELNVNGDQTFFAPSQLIKVNAPIETEPPKNTINDLTNNILKIMSI